MENDKEALKSWVRHFQANESCAIEALGRDNYHTLIHDLEKAAHASRLADDVVELQTRLDQMKTLYFDLLGAVNSTPGVPEMLCRFDKDGNEVSPLLSAQPRVSDEVWKQILQALHYYNDAKEFKGHSTIAGQALIAAGIVGAK